MNDETEAVVQTAEVTGDSETFVSVTKRIRSPQLISDASWSLVSNLGSVVGGLATLRMITSLVSVREYGEATLALGVVSLISFFTVNPLFTAHLRIYFDHLKAGQSQTYLRRLRGLLLMAGALSILIY